MCARDTPALASFSRRSSRSAAISCFSLPARSARFCCRCTSFLNSAWVASSCWHMCVTRDVGATRALRRRSAASTARACGGASPCGSTRLAAIRRQPDPSCSHV
eukprot:scaffold7843_cov108-Isochrysis_galbana.AAC.2